MLDIIYETSRVEYSRKNSDAHYRRRTCEINPKLEVLKIVMIF
jgi:hypothetical protein